MGSFDLAASRSWEHVWLVKWTDVAQGYHFSCEKRFPTKPAALAFFDRFAERERLFYSGAMAPLCPFRDARIIKER